MLLAAGMVSAVGDLALEVAGVAYDRHGIPTGPTLRTNVGHIYAIGDVRAGAYQLSPVATKQGTMVAGNALRGGEAPSTTVWSPTSSVSRRRSRAWC